MKITRALEVLQTKQPESSDISDEDEEAAANLAIEALKRVKNNRGNGFPVLETPLPGETKE